MDEKIVKDSQGLAKELVNDCISRRAAIDIVRFECGEWEGLAKTIIKRFEQLPSAQPEPIRLWLDHELSKEEYERLKKDCAEQPIILFPKESAQRWISCSERLPEINQTVLLSTTDGEVIVGYRYKPDIVWQVTANDGRKIWVYDPENYPGNIDELPKAETCGFENRDNCWLSVTSINYDLKFAGISAWMSLPEPYKGDDK